MSLSKDNIIAILFGIITVLLALIPLLSIRRCRWRQRKPSIPGTQASSTQSPIALPHPVQLNVNHCMPCGRYRTSPHYPSAPPFPYGCPRQPYRRDRGTDEEVSAPWPGLEQDPFPAFALAASSTEARDPLRWSSRGHDIYGGPCHLFFSHLRCATGRLLRSSCLHLHLHHHLHHHHQRGNRNNNKTMRLPFLPSLLAFSSTAPRPTPTPLPLLIWHGLGDTYDAAGLTSTASLAARTVPGTSVYIIRLSNTSSLDRRATFLGNVSTQLSSVCDTIATHPVLSQASAVNALGFSQGGQFLRGYVERCNDPPVRNLVTFGSQHNGISSFQTCAQGDWVCKGVEALLGKNTWGEFAQSSLVPAQYFRDAEDLEPYLQHSNFLADINNERILKTAAYKANLGALKRFVMYIFDEDETVVPKESGWFAEVNRTSGTVTPLREREMYKEDWLGLRGLDVRGGLVFRNVSGEHMRLTDEVLVDAFERYFGAEEAGRAGGVLKDALEAGGSASRTATQKIEELWIDL